MCAARCLAAGANLAIGANQMDRFAPGLFSLNYQNMNFKFSAACKASIEEWNNVKKKLVRLKV